MLTKEINGEMDYFLYAEFDVISKLIEKRDCKWLILNLKDEWLKKITRHREVLHYVRSTKHFFSFC